jgi:serine/threonine protein kinase/Tfp pilus assembly protein PilF
VAQSKGLENFNSAVRILKDDSMATEKPEFIDGSPTTFAPPGNDTDRTMPPGEGVAGGEAGEVGHHPVTIGHYRILRLLGEGGMGSVYLAEQENPHRVVALKVIKPGFVNAEVLRRFEQETHALGRLQHPGIAQIYEAGTADSGFGPQPYFAMEFIEGQTLIEYVEARHLNLRARLELIAKVCDAVNHAHQRGLIHRDLKPGNIIVDETGQPKILDFGVARVTDSDVEMTRQTDMGQLIGTLNYMSPEQVLANPEELDIRSDVYALGVIAYQLLTGKMPYDTNRKAIHEVVRAIREEDPAPLSSINRTYRGDVQTIVAKALEKDKTRRYASAAELADDIRRYLADQPIVAHPPSTSYQLQKFARRHRALVAGAAAVFLVLIAGVVVSTWQAVKARRAEASAQAVSDFLQNDLLGSASPTNQSGPTTAADPDLKVRTALDRAAERITGKFDKQPEVEAAIRDTIGQTYFDLGLYAQAMKQLELALDLRRRVDGKENPKTLNTARRLGDALIMEHNHHDASVALLDQTVQSMRRVLGPKHPDTLKAMNSLAYAYAGEDTYPQAETLFREALEIERRVLGPDHPDTLVCMDRLAIVYNNEGKYEQAEALDSQVVERQRRVLGPEHPETLHSMMNLGGSYSNQGKYPQAEAIFSQTLEAQKRVQGPEHHLTVITMYDLADVYSHEGKREQAEAILSQAVEINRRVLAPGAGHTVYSLGLLGTLYSRDGKYEQAEALFREANEINSRDHGPEDPVVLNTSNDLANGYSDEGKYEQAEGRFHRTLATARRVLRPEDPITLTSMNGLAVVYAREGKYGLAEPYATQALAGRRHTLDRDNPRTTASAANLALIYESQGKFTQSEPLAREIEARERTKHPDDWIRFWAESLLGASLAGEKNYAEAEPLLLEGYRGMLERKDRIPVPSWRDLDRAHEWIVQMYVAWGKPQKAAEWRHS